MDKSRRRRKILLIVRAARIVLQRPDGKILIIRRSTKNGWDHLKWELPGGKINPNRRIVEGLSREVKEETGLSVVGLSEKDRLQRRDRVNKSGRFAGEHYKEWVYRSAKFRGRVRRGLSDEHNQFKWVTVRGALNHRLTADAQGVFEFLLEQGDV